MPDRLYFTDSDEANALIASDRCGPACPSVDYVVGRAPTEFERRRVGGASTPGVQRREQAPSVMTARADLVGLGLSFG